MPSIQIVGAQNGTRYAGTKQANIDSIPDECPLCHRHIVPETVAQGFEYDDRLEMVFRCANPKCFHNFISIYSLDRGLTSSARVQSFRYQRSVPSEPIREAIPAAVEAVSPSFVRIKTQAQAAEGAGLDEIAGPGYRKALEFLVKDYAISLTTDAKDHEAIRAMTLQAVIKKYFTGDKLTVVSSRAAWLGNDETHYERRWVDKDLQDLKKLLEATEHFIAMEKLAADIPTEMPEPQKTS